MMILELLVFLLTLIKSSESSELEKLLYLSKSAYPGTFRLDDFPSIHKSPTVFACDVVIPETVDSTALLFKIGSLEVDIASENGEVFLSGRVGISNLIEFSAENIPNDGQVHTLIFEVSPHPARIRVFIDDELYVDIQHEQGKNFPVFDGSRVWSYWFPSMISSYGVVLSGDPTEDRSFWPEFPESMVSNLRIYQSQLVRYPVSTLEPQIQPGILILGKDNSSVVEVNFWNNTGLREISFQFNNILQGQRYRLNLNYSFVVWDGSHYESNTTSAYWNHSGQRFELKLVPAFSYIGIFQVYNSETDYVVSFNSSALITFSFALNNFSDIKVGWVSLEPVCDSGYIIRATDNLKSCVPCSGGSFIDELEKATCTLCLPGKYQNSTGKTVCEDCPLGSKSEIQGNSFCTPCEPGSYADREGSILCSFCNPGRFVADSGSTNVEDCLECEAGKISTAYGRMQCQDCPAGKTSDASRTSCTSCPLGTFNSEAGSGVCQQCLVGTYADEVDSVTCKSCPGGRYGPDIGSTDVSGCIFCPYGTYNPVEGSAVAGDCLPCPQEDGIVCQEGSAIPSLREGFWRDTDDNPNLILRCVPEIACLPLEGTGVTQCSEGYTGRACSQCVERIFYRSGLLCKPCGGKFVKWLIFTLLILAFFFAISRLMTKPSSYPYADIRIASNWIQFVSLYAPMSSVWPPLLVQFFSFSSLINFDLQFFGVECETKIDFWVMWRLKLAAPIAIGSLYVIVLIFYPKLVRVRQYFGSKVVINKDYKHYLLYSFIFCFSLLYTLLISTVVSPFNCFPQLDGRLSLSQDPAVDCYDKTWWNNLPFIILGSLLYILGFPLFIAFVFYRNKDVVLSKDKARRDEFISNFGSLVLPYRDEYYWWELVNLIHKCITVVFSKFFATELSGDTRIFMVVVALFVRMYAENMVKPFKEDFDNQIALTWGLVDIIVLSTVFSFSSPEISIAEKIGFSIGVICLISVTLAFSLYHIIKRGFEYFRNKPIFQKLSNGILKKITMLINSKSKVIESTLDDPTRSAFATAVPFSATTQVPETQVCTLTVRSEFDELDKQN